MSVAGSSTMSHMCGGETGEGFKGLPECLLLGARDEVVAALFSPSTLNPLRALRKQAQTTKTQQKHQRTKSRWNAIGKQKTRSAGN